MAGFGIDPTSLSLSPAGYLQHRRARKAQDIGEAQFERNLIEKEADRKARFAELQFDADQKLLIEKAKTEAKLLADEAKSTKEIRTWAENRANEAIKAGNATFDQWDELVDYFIGVKTGQARQPQPQFQPAGAEGGYDLRTEEAALEEEMGRMKQAKQQPAPYTEMIPTVTGGEGSYVLETQENLPEELRKEQGQPARELTLEEINKQILDEYKAGQAPTPAPVTPPAPRKPEIPEAVVKTRYAPEYRRETRQIKNATRTINQIKKDEARLEKLIKSPAFSPNKKKYRDDLKKLKARREKLKGKVDTSEKRLIAIERESGEKWEAKREKLEKPTSREATRTKNLIKYFEEINKGKITQSREEGFSHDEKKKLEPILKRYNAILKKEGSPELELYYDTVGKNKWRLREKAGTATSGNEQETLIQDNMRAYGKSREEVISALKAKGLL